MGIRLLQKLSSPKTIQKPRPCCRYGLKTVTRRIRQELSSSAVGSEETDLASWSPCSAVEKHLVKLSPLLAWKADQVPTESVRRRKEVGGSQKASICSSSLAGLGKVCQERVSCFADKKKWNKNIRNLESHRFETAPRGQTM